VKQDGTLKFMPTQNVMDEVARRLPLKRLLDKLVKRS
jgi:hypothetical protein